MYIQTWAKVSKLRRLPLIGNMFYRSAQWFCGKITGHENSKTEWGYGGGEYADVWCRWCNKMGRVPVKNIENLHKGARTIIWNYTGCDIQHKEWTPDA